MTKIIIANWKMNYSFDEADLWLSEFFKFYGAAYEKVSKHELVLCPPAILLDYIDSELMEDGFQFLEEVAKKDSRSLEDFSAEEINEIVMNQRPIKLGAQDCHYEESGSFTGDVSAKMLKDVGCKYVIIGHSERRSAYLESDAVVTKKISTAIKADLTPILCVGESKASRDAAQHLEFVESQVVNALLGDLSCEKLIIAYEPIWAIGSGITPSVAQIDEVTKAIKKILQEKFAAKFPQVFVLYGGSVSSANSAEILPVCDGLLIGKASLTAEEYIKIASF